MTIAERTYSVEMTCKNCGYRGKKDIPCGVQKPTLATCPICECKTYIPLSELWRG